jgi:hypothetical protein
MFDAAAKIAERVRVRIARKQRHFRAQQRRVSGRLNGVLGRIDQTDAPGACAVDVISELLT